MFIRNCLTEVRHLTVIHPQDSIRAVLDQMGEHLSLPCVSQDLTFVGIVSKRTIFEAFQKQTQSGVTYEAFLDNPVECCVNSNITPLSMTSNFEDTLDIIIRHPFVPIVENGKFLGIVKRGDVNQALSVAFGTNVKSHRLLLGLADVEGALQLLFSVTHRLGIDVITAVPFDAGEKALNRRLMLKVDPSSNLKQLVEHLERAGFLIIEAN